MRIAYYFITTVFYYLLYPYLYFRILKKNSKKKIHKSKVLVIGDNLNTDISGANIPILMKDLE